MATTVVESDLTVSITESYTLNGVEYGGTINKVFSDNGEVVKRIMNISTGSFSNLFDYETESVKGTFTYLRVTNLDDTNFVTLQVVDSNDDAYYIKLNAGESHILMDNCIDVVENPATFGSFSDIAICAAEADTSACDVEFLTVLK